MTNISVGARSKPLSARGPVFIEVQKQIFAACPQLTMMISVFSRPHSSLGYQPPATFAKLQARRFQSPLAPSANLPVAEKAVA